MRTEKAHLAEARPPRETASPRTFKTIETPETRIRIGMIKIGEKHAVKSGLKPIAIGGQATTECFIRGTAKKSFLVENS